MEVRDPMSKKKRSPLVIAGIVSAGVVVIVGAVLLVYFVFFQAGSIYDTWHDEAETCEYTFYEDNKMIVDTPYGNYVGTYVIDLSTGKGMISVNEGSVSFTFEDEKVKMGNGDVLTRGEIDVVHVTTAVAETTEATETSEPEMTSMTTEQTTVTETTAVETTTETEASSETATPTSEPTATPTPTPEPTVSPTPFEPIVTFPTFVFETINPSFFVVGTPVIGEWAGPDPETYSVEFFEDNTCIFYNDGIETGSGTYEYNFFSGEGTIEYESLSYEFTVVEDELLLHFGSWGDIPYYRV